MVIVKIKKQLKDAGIEPDPLQDQFFLEDEKVLRKIAELGELNKEDVVVEIGAGPGNLTKYLAKQAGRVIAYEIDECFEPFLREMPRNVEVHFGDASEYVQQGGKFWKKKEYNKIVANIPYSIGEWLLHNLTFVEYEKVILLVAEKFAESIKDNPVFANFFKVEKKLQVPRSKFYPEPGSDSVVIELVRLKKPSEKKDLGLYLKQSMYRQEDRKVKNALRTGLILYVKQVYGKQLTKNQARKIVEKSAITENLLERLPDNRKVYEQVGERFEDKMLKEFGFK